MFVGRSDEKHMLTSSYDSSKSELAIIYGRRRIGKSILIQNFVQDKPSLSFEALENERTQEQIQHFTTQLKQQLNSALFANLNFNNWEEAFSFLTEYSKTQEQKLIIFFDEFQWMAAGRSKLVTLIKFYWDNQWKQQNIMLILCGSIASYMVNQVIKSKALYGRSSLEIKLDELSPNECFTLLKNKRSWEEVLQYMLILGGIPKYLEEIDTSKSLSQNMNALFFKRNSIFNNEFDKVFYAQFKAPQKYRKILSLLAKGPLTLDGVSINLKITSGGSLKSYLDHLELSGFVRSQVPFGKKSNSKLKIYKLSDPYIIFYFKYIEPNINSIEDNSSRNLFKLLVEKHWQPWLGYRFESFCLKNHEHLARLMGFNEELISAAPYFEKHTLSASGFQIDLLFERADKTITLCEVKYRNQPLDASIIAEVEAKASKIHVPRGYTLEKAIVSLYGVDEKTESSGYFHHIVKAADLFE
ncbi:MAG: AAA family ATPase [Pseudomonadales bacterium]|nr:AAA family ATPase [Pseudomonadales bacterium]